MTIDVVVAAYNPGDLLRRALGTVVAQTYTGWRAVVVDDGSTEDLGWVNDYDPRISLITQSNHGVSVARNVGVDATDSALIAFLDQDDEWLPTKLARQIDALTTAPTAPFSFTEFTWVLPHGEVAGTYSADVSYLDLLGGQHILLSSMVVRRENYDAVGGHDPALAMVQDFDLFLRLTIDGGTPACVHESLVRYHVHGANASSNYRLAHREGTAVLHHHRDLARQRHDRVAIAAARRGLLATRRLYADQALQAYRSSRRPADLARAFAWSPSATGASVVVGLRNRLRRTR